MKCGRTLLLAAALAACSGRQKTEAPSPATADATTAAEDGTWVATPADLTAEQVKTVQRALGDRGFPVELSGSYDGQTKTAVSDFQRSRGLPTTGNVNAETAAALGLDASEVMPVRGANARPK